MSAYVDGALRGPKREQFERELDGDAGLARDVQRSRALGQLVREAWSEGPTAPSPDFLLASIRPALAEIDRERNARPAWQRGFESALARLGAALRPSPILATAAAVAFVAALAVIPRFEIGTAVQTSLAGPVEKSAGPIARASEPAATTPAPPLTPAMPAGFTADGPGSVYDVWPGRPAVLFHSVDGSTMLWLIDDGDLSFRIGSARHWG